MPSITLTLTNSELTQAVHDWVAAKGYGTTDRFAVSVTTAPGDRPFDPDCTTATVTGVVSLRD